MLRRKYLVVCRKWFDENEFSIIAGPCPIEREEQMDVIAVKIREFGITMLRDGAYKTGMHPLLFSSVTRRFIYILNP